MAKARILVVEDEAVVAHDLQSTLTRLGYEAPAPVASGEAALACLEEVRPDLVLMDIHLAGKMDGIATAERIRGRMHLPIVYLTAHSDEATFRRASITEPYAYILKPFEERELTIAIDIALYRHAVEGKLGQVERWLASTLNSMGDAVIATDAEGRVTFVNDVAEALTGWDRGEALGRRLAEVLRLVDGDKRAPVPDLVHRVVGEETVIEIGDCLLVARDGRERPVDDSAAPIRDASGGVIGVVVVFRDVGARKQVEERLHHAATHDPLTGLPNRALLLDRLTRVFEYSKRHPQHSFAVLLMDLDRFKAINDGLGHLSGDRVLTTVARRLETEVRAPDTVARLGGDEFVVLLDGIASVREALLVSERVLRSLEAPIDLEGHEVSALASIGIVLSGSAYASPDEILRDADAALYRAKGTGKGRSVVFDADLHDRAVSSLRLERDLRRAPAREFLFHYQPIVSLADERVCGVEALLRWQHPERGLLLPGDFLELAQETGFLDEIGESLLRKACQQVLAWNGVPARDRPITMSVNLSRRQFERSDLVQQVARVLSETRLEPRALCLDVTEAVLADPEVRNRTLRRLHELGVRLHVDDFGTGPSSLSVLDRAPIDTLKIDRALVRRLDGGEAEATIVRAIAHLARELGMEVIAEGVETEAQASYLKGLDCGYGQGNWFSRPLDAEGVAAIVGGKSRGRRARPD
jgi:diguanylate cyclase (GGDEF)-like protein/PAS domain S-box-containing protein